MVNRIVSMVQALLLLFVLTINSSYAETKTEAEEGLNETLAFWEWLGSNGDKAIEAFDAEKKSKEG